ARVWFSVQPIAGGATPVQMPVASSATWSHHTIPLDQVRGSLASFGKLNFMGERVGQKFYVDNVQLVARGSGTIPSQPVVPSYDAVVTMYSSASAYDVYVPRSYDGTHRTPTRLLLWMHGCGGQAYGDAWTVSPGGSQSWITVSVGGRDYGCWDVDHDSAIVLAALADVKHRLNVDARRVVIGGYSSGGDLAYRTAFY